MATTTVTHVRLRLRFSNACHEPSWLFVNKCKTKSISELADYIQLKFPQTTGLQFKLTLGNFLLPFWETSEILHNGDVIKVQFEKDVQFGENQDKTVQPLPHLPANGLERNSEDSESAGRKRKKKKKKQEALDDSEIKGSERVEVDSQEEQDGEPVHKKRKKSRKNRQADETLKQNDRICEGKESKNENTIGKKKQTLSSESNEVDRGSKGSELGDETRVQLAKCGSDTNRCENNVTNKSDSEGESAQKNRQFIDTETKKKRKRRRKRKKTEENQANEPDNAIGSNTSMSDQHKQDRPAFALVKRRKNKQVLNNHKHFGESEGEEDDRQSVNDDKQSEDFPHDNEVNSTPTEQREGYSAVGYLYGDNDPSSPSSTADGNGVTVTKSMLTNGTAVFTRKRKYTRKWPELTKEQQLNTEATNKSVVIQNAVSDVCLSDLETIPVVKSYEEFPLLTGPPRSGDKIAYKILEITPEYTPEVSGYKEGTVLSYDPDDKTVSLKIIPGVSNSTGVGCGKFDISIEDEDIHLTNMTKTTNEVSLSWNLLLQPRLLM